MTSLPVERARALLRASPLKQEKVKYLLRYVGDASGLRCLDIGGDNGVVSLLLRTAGGTWVSVDGAPEAARAIRQVVGPSVCQIEGVSLPIATASLDLAVVADYLEHVHDDHGLIRELARILKPGGRLIVNVPHVKARSALTPIRHAVGLTDAWHGHVRPGYRWAALEAMLPPLFTPTRHETYCRGGSEALDIVLNAARLRLDGAPTSSVKGPIIAVDGFDAHSKQARAFQILGPVLRTIVSLDRLLVFQSGYRLIASALRTDRPL